MAEIEKMIPAIPKPNAQAKILIKSKCGIWFNIQRLYLILAHLV